LDKSEVECEPADDGEEDAVEEVETEEVGEETEFEDEEFSSEYESEDSDSESKSNIVAMSSLEKLNVADSSSSNHVHFSGLPLSPLSTSGSKIVVVFPSSRFPRWTIQKGRVGIEKSVASLCADLILTFMLKL